MLKRSERATRSDSRCGSCPQHANIRRTLTTVTGVTVPSSPLPHHERHSRQKRPDSENRRPPSPVRSGGTIVPSPGQIPSTYSRQPSHPSPESSRYAGSHEPGSRHPLPTPARRQVSTPNNVCLAASDSPPESQRLAPLCSRRIRNPDASSLTHRSSKEATQREFESNGFLPRTAERSCCQS
jgi:hypothetical protein